MLEDIHALLDNAAPIDPNDARYRKLLSDVQCNILSPHRKRRAHYLFLRFVDGADARELPAKYLLGVLACNAFERARVLAAVCGGVNLLPERYCAAVRPAGRNPGACVTPAQRTLLADVGITSELAAKRFNGARGDGFAINCLLTRHGCRKLQVELPDAAFIQGQAARWQRLNDPEPTTGGQSPSWDAPYDDADAVLIVAYDPGSGDAGEHQKLVLNALRALISGHSTVIVEEEGYSLRRSRDDRPIEAFGFRDGISQPQFFIESNVVPSQARSWNDFAPLRTVLTPDPYGQTPHACGSYFVFRKLRQHVFDFHGQVQSLARTLNRPAADVLAELVGRHPNGEPLASTSSDTLNDFDFSDDQSATRCPGYAHIRKVNPRRDVKPIYGAEQRRIVRRGLSYGPELARDDEGLPTLDPAHLGDAVGMLFLCAQANIAEQFEHLQAHWANNQQIPRSLMPGPDAIVGRTAPGESLRIAARDEHGLIKHIDYRSFVEMRGGTYLFAPSISFLKSQLNDVWM